MSRLSSVRLPQEMDTLAPDLSEIRLLVTAERGGMAHCTLPPGHTSLAVRHHTVEEIWYVVAGEGQVWRSLGDEEELDVSPGVSLTIPTGAHFQFRATGAEPLCILIVTMPPWPGAHEAERVPDHWPIE